MKRETNLKKLAVTFATVGALASAMLLGSMAGALEYNKKKDRWGFTGAIKSYWLPEKRLDGAIRMTCYPEYHKYEAGDRLKTWEQTVEMKKFDGMGLAEYVMVYGSDKWVRGDLYPTKYGWRCYQGYVDIEVIDWDGNPHHVGRVFPCKGSDNEGNKVKWVWITYVSPDRKSAAARAGCVEPWKGTPVDMNWGGYTWFMSNIPGEKKDWK